LAGFLGKLTRLRDCVRRGIPVAHGHPVEYLNVENVNEETQSTLLSQLRFGAVQKVDRANRVADGVRRRTQEPKLDGVVDCLEHDPLQALDHLDRVAIPVGYGERRDGARIIVNIRELTHGLHNLGPCVAPGIGPPTAQRGRQEEIQGKVEIAGCE
jgi:hypothetical protein